MTETRLRNPPLLVERYGEWWVEIVLDNGKDTFLAPVGDGAFLYQQIVEKLVLPRLRRSLAATEITAAEALQASVTLATHDHLTGEPLSWEQYLSSPRSAKVMKLAHKDPTLMALLEGALGPKPVEQPVSRLRRPQKSDD